MQLREQEVEDQQEMKELGEVGVENQAQCEQVGGRRQSPAISI